MKRANTTLLLLFVACCLAVTLDAKEMFSATPIILKYETDGSQGRGEPTKALRAQLRKSAPTQPPEFRIELLVEGDPPFEPNKPIQFAVLAEPWEQNLEYRYFFGDGPPTGWLGDSRFPHSYTNPGTYRVYAEVRSKGVFATAGPWSTNPVRVQVARREGPISVKLETLNGPPFRVGDPLRFAARTERAGMRLEYQFLFGDGRSSGWMQENRARHTYAAAGTYQVVVFVREPPLEGQAAPPVASNGRAMLRVVIQPDPFRDGQQAVRLNAHPVQIRAGEPIRLEAHAEPETEGIGFVFEFGDGQSSKVQPERTTEHLYVNPGAYGAIVRIYRGDVMVAESQPVNITVTPEPNHRLFLEVTNTNPGTMERVRFTWHVEPPATEVLYHVDFGDGYSGWVSEGWAEHPYRNSGAYRVLLKARIGRKDVQSNEIVVTVKEAVPYWLYPALAIILGAAGAIVLVWRIVARARNKKHSEVAAVDTTIVVKPHKDFGARSLEFSRQVSASLEVRFQPFPDSGKQVMEHGMITRRTNLHSSGDRGGSEEPIAQHPVRTQPYPGVRRGERRSDNEGIHLKANWYKRKEDDHE